MPSGSPSSQLKGAQVLHSVDNVSTDQNQVAGVNYWLSPLLDLTAFQWVRLNYFWSATTGSNPQSQFQFSWDGATFYKLKADLLHNTGVLPRQGMYFIGQYETGQTVLSTAGNSAIDGTTEIINNILIRNEMIFTPPFGRFMIYTAVTARQDFSNITIDAGTR